MANTKTPQRKFTAKTAGGRARRRGRTEVSATPIAIRSSVPLTPAFETAIRVRLARAVGHMATLIERGTVRFEDVNGPRGGVDVECRVRLVMSGIPSVIASARGATAPKAFAAVLPKVKTGAQRTVDKRAIAAPPPTTKKAAAKKKTPARRAKQVAVAGSLIGRRVGRSAENLTAALDRPEKRRRDAYVDTSMPGVSATARRAGGTSTARRNTKKRTSRMAAALEDSARDTPSRKSTRPGGPNRLRSGNKLGQRARASTSSPKARAKRARSPRPS
ncbi:hypothetical protein [Sandaracinus amylolyticus]|uniref:Uncharacterized protein n=1 Tax=Sandaracinus amylolyticus TaxID=927083 RepID=A0A0F6W9X0_9BACT|nr:hypothetical protein [Sandaracinus amylolyticus]AKF11077.1 hypothetical protein DB32_008226 [Sandaracinus amylolyticus]